MRKVARTETEVERKDLPHLPQEDSKPDKKEKDKDLPDLAPEVSKPREADKEGEATDDTDDSTGPQPVAAATAGQEGLLHYINFASSETAETVHPKPKANTKPKPNTVSPKPCTSR